MNKVIHNIEPFYQRDSLILILGSMPSIKSREEGFFYAHPKNRFWKVLGLVLNEEITTKDDKINLLKKHKIALWDTIKSCTIIGSSDSSITDVEVNDIKSLINKSNIKYIFTTGKTSYNYYQKYIEQSTKINAIYLPSPSPANCAIKLDKMIEEYLVIKNKLEEINQTKL